MEHLNSAQLSLPFMFLLGLQHGLGPDHLAAVTSLIARGGGARRASWVGLQFGLGHMGVLGFACLLSLLCKLSIPPGFDRIAEIAGGIVLILMGLWMTRDLCGVQVYAHRHRHEHDGSAHEHVHLHVGDPDAPHPAQHGHPHAATLFGGLFAFSGARAMLTMVVFLMAKLPSLPALVAYVVLFGAGIIFSMSLYGALVSRFYKLAARHELVFRAVTVLTILATVGTGLFWLHEQL